MAIVVRQITAIELFDGLYSDGSTNVTPAKRFVRGWVDGTDAGEANKYYELAGTATAGGTLIDINGGGGVSDVFATAIAMTSVLAFFFRVTTSTSGAGVLLAGDFVTSTISSSASITLNELGVYEWAEYTKRTVSGNTISITRRGSVDSSYQGFLVGIAE